MAKLVFAILAAVFAVTVSAAQADTLPGSTLAVKFTTGYACKQADCGGLANGKLSATHRFEIPPAELSQIDSKPSVTINVFGEEIPLIMSDDPKFVDGATSARIKRQVPIRSFALGTANINALITWGDAVFTVSVKGSFTGASLSGPAFADLKAKDLEQVNLETRLENAGALIHDEKAFLLTSASENYYELHVANGDSQYRGKYARISPKQQP
jgi:hypothetical protein